MIIITLRGREVANFVTIKMPHFKIRERFVIREKKIATESHGSRSKVRECVTHCASSCPINLGQKETQAAALHTNGYYIWWLFRAGLQKLKFAKSNAFACSAVDTDTVPTFAAPGWLMAAGRQMRLLILIWPRIWVRFFAHGLMTIPMQTMRI